jgi:hypothetical protein
VGTLSKLRQYDEALQKVHAIRILELGCGERHTAVVLETGNVFVWGYTYIHITYAYAYTVRALHDLPAAASCLLLTAHCSLLTAHCSLLTAHCSLLTAHYSLLATHQVERQGPARHAARRTAGFARDAHAEHAQGTLGAALHSAERPLLWPVLHLRLVVMLVTAQSRLKWRVSGLH